MPSAGLKATPACKDPRAQTVAANGVANLNITAIVRNACGCDGSLLSLVLDGVASVVNNLAVTVEKL